MHWYSNLALIVAMILASGIPIQAQVRTEIYDLQERCAKSAAEKFDKEYPKEERKPGLAFYENHYNVRLNRCFMLVDDTIQFHLDGASKKYRTLQLVDLHANKVYGSFDSRECEVMEKKCKSELEFRQLIRPYMED
jgi:hypothetical protein